MKIIIKKVYYCDYCKKHSLRSLTKHEEHCTLNPNRVCGFCGNQSDLNPIIEKLGLKAKIKHHIDVNEIYLEIDYECPACTLAIIRLLNDKSDEEIICNFNYNEAVAKWWNEHNINGENL